MRHHSPKGMTVRSSYKSPERELYGDLLGENHGLKERDMDNSQQPNSFLDVILLTFTLQQGPPIGPHNWQSNTGAYYKE